MSEPGLPEGHGAVAPRGVAVFVEGETTTYGAPERVADEAGWLPSRWPVSG